MSQNLPKQSLRDFLSLHHPNHFVLAGANNRNVIITYLVAPLRANRDFFWHTDCWLYISTVSTFLTMRASRSPWRELPECLLGSLVPRRFRLGHSWTLPWAVTSPRDTHRERVLSPALSQTSRGERIKREGLGTRLPPRNFAFLAKSLRGQQLTLTWSPFPPQIAGTSRGGRM